MRARSELRPESGVRSLGRAGCGTGYRIPDTGFAPSVLVLVLDRCNTLIMHPCARLSFRSAFYFFFQPCFLCCDVFTLADIVFIFSVR